MCNKIEYYQIELKITPVRRLILRKLTYQINFFEFVKFDTISIYNVYVRSILTL